MLFVDAKGLATLEQYVAALVSGIVSLKTLAEYHLQAYRIGILSEDEVEISKTICWEIERLVQLYVKQVGFVVARTEIDENTVFDELKKIMPRIMEKNE